LELRVAKAALGARAEERNTIMVDLSLSET
jgi:hypothetical protein